MMTVGSLREQRPTIGHINSGTAIAGLLVLLAVIGCRSHVIKVNVVNSSTEKISNVIIDYPGATFGISSLAPGKTFQYAIKPNDMIDRDRSLVHRQPLTQICCLAENSP